MTKKEKILVKKAIRLIHNDDDYFAGMNVLAKLVGWPEVKFPAGTVPIDASIIAAKESMNLRGLHGRKIK